MIYRRGVGGLDADEAERHCQEFHQQGAVRQHPKYVDSSHRHRHHLIHHTATHTRLLMTTTVVSQRYQRVSE